MYAQTMLHGKNTTFVNLGKEGVTDLYIEANVIHIIKDGKNQGVPLSGAATIDYGEVEVSKLEPQVSASSARVKISLAEIKKNVA